LGFGNKQNYIRNFVRDSPYSGIQKAFQRVVDARLLLDNLTERVHARLTRLRRRHHMKGDNPGLAGF